jgi:hypothetical protein
METKEKYVPHFIDAMVLICCRLAGCLPRHPAEAMSELPVPGIRYFDDRLIRLARREQVRA